MDEGNVSVESQSWMEKNKVLVMAMSVLIVLILVVGLVMVSKRNKANVQQQPPPAVPAFVGGGSGWEESVSHYGQPYY